MTDWSNWTPPTPPHPLAYEHLRTDTCMQTLNLAEHALGDAGATQLADALRANTSTSLQTLYLCMNSIGEAGATQLADALRTNTSVNKLFLGGNSIGDAGATQLADALRTNTSAEVLTSATTRSAMRERRSSLTRCALTNTSVKELHLHNSVRSAGLSPQCCVAEPWSAARPVSKTALSRAPRRTA